MEAAGLVSSILKGPVPAESRVSLIPHAAWDVAVAAAVAVVLLAGGVGADAISPAVKCGADNVLYYQGRPAQRAYSVIATGPAPQVRQD